MSFDVTGVHFFASRSDSSLSPVTGSETEMVAPAAPALVAATARAHQLPPGGRAVQALHQQRFRIRACGLARVALTFGRS